MKAKSFFSRAAAAPHIVWSVMFIVAPLLFVLYYALTDPNGAFTLSNIAALPEYGGTFFLSISLSLIATIICILIGYPMAYFISRAKPSRQPLLLMAALVPMWINLLIRTFSMMAILDDGGLINTLLGTNLHIVGTKGAVIFGMVYDFLPYMILPIYTVMSKMDKRVLEAASDLGCNHFEVLLRVVLPLTRSGIVSGVTMVFVPSISTFYISQKLGGGTFELLGDTIERQFANPDTYNVGAAISLVMMVLILLSMAIMNKFADEDAEGGMLP
ncbi:MAG: ABC transporter permease [Clostridia bacterium]|nr:ABC transporter permease [Clostridia bacterium]